jgi:RecA-family ATPase
LGQTYSGSTAWNNSVRSRIALVLPSAEGENAERAQDDGRRLLVVEKTNYGRSGLTIALRYNADAGVFVRDGDQTAGTFVGAIRDRTERRAILRLLLKCEEVSRSVMTPEKSNHNAATILGEKDDYPKALKSGSQGRKRLWQHLRRLTDDGLIETEPFKTAARHRTERWKVTPSGRIEANSQ